MSDFFEHDEDPAVVQARFDAGDKGRTGPSLLYRITFDHRPSKDRWRCGCGDVGEWTKNVKQAQLDAVEHGRTHSSGRSQSHDEFCSDLMYGWHDEAGRFQEPVATLANSFAAHEQYHRRVVDQKVVSQTDAARPCKHPVGFVKTCGTAACPTCGEVRRTSADASDET